MLGFDDYEINNLSEEDFNELKGYHPRETVVEEEYIITYFGVDEAGKQMVKEVKASKSEIYEKIKEHKEFKEKKAKKEKKVDKRDKKYFQCHLSMI